LARRGGQDAAHRRRAGVRVTGHAPQDGAREHLEDDVARGRVAGAGADDAAAAEGRRERLPRSDRDPLEQDRGAEILFERVAIRPGKPFTAARRGRCIVCACPGNPASTYVIFQVFARAVLRRMAGHPHPGPAPVRGVLAAAARQRPGRAGYCQARATLVEGRLMAEILPTSGSADMVACARGNALVVLPAGTDTRAAGEEVDILLLDDSSDR